VAVGATVYYASQESRRQIMEVSEAFARAHELGMVTFLWAYLRNADFKKDDTDYHTASDLTGQANHLAATIEADVVKQKQAATNGGFTAIELGKTHPKVYSELTSDHPIDPPPRVDGLCNCQRLRARAISTKILPADARFGSFPEKCLRALFEECRHRCDPVFRTSRMARVLEAQSAMRSTDLASGWTTLAAPKAESPRRSRTTDPRRAMRS